MDIYVISLIFTIYNIVTQANGSIVQPQINGANAALLYLSRFGYMDPSATNMQMGALMGKDVIHSAIRDFQAFAGLNQTGILDEVTVEMMNTPRCGVVDKVGYGANAKRRKRYALQGSRWKVSGLTYTITKYPKLLTKGEVDRDIAKAFDVWSEITDLTFHTKKSKSEKVHIEIRFERSEHGDGDPFDGPGGTLAHAYFPIYGGDAHFDDSETWTVNSYRGTNLFQVAAHEFGHSLGLSHSDVTTALMAPFYRGYQSKFKLDVDDIKGIQSLYGVKKPKGQHTPAPTPSVPNRPNKPSSGDSLLCQDGAIDAITIMEEQTYVFKGKYVWKLNNDGIVRGYPHRISTKFIGLPSDIDAVFTWTNGKTYFFKGSKYWRTTGFTMDEDYPKEISKGFSGIPNYVDAAFVWSGNGKIYFFKGTNYYKFDPLQKPPVSQNYPKDSTMWEGLPYYIDDALQYSNGFTYFFKNGKYWRFNDRSFKVDSADPPFPRQTGKWWFGCPDKGNQVEKNTSDANPTLSAQPDLRNDASYDYSDSYDDYYYDDANINPKFGYSKDSRNSGSVVGVYWVWIVTPVLLRIICS